MNSMQRKYADVSILRIKRGQEAKRGIDFSALQPEALMRSKVKNDLKGSIRRLREMSSDWEKDRDTLFRMLVQMEKEETAAVLRTKKETIRERTV